jgi:hypothetical protein
MTFGGRTPLPDGVEPAPDVLVDVLVEVEVDEVALDVDVEDVALEVALEVEVEPVAVEPPPPPPPHPMMTAAMVEPTSIGQERWMLLLSVMYRNSLLI